MRRSPFCEVQRAGLGRDFALEIEAGLAKISLLLHGWRKLGPRVRRYRLRRSPYGLVYAPLRSEIVIVIVAVMHLHRKPGYWRPRLQP